MAADDAVIQLTSMEDYIIRNHEFCDCGEKMRITANSGDCIVDIIQAHRVGPDFVDSDSDSDEKDYLRLITDEFEEMQKNRR